MSDYQGKRFKASQIPDPSKPGAARAAQQGRTSSSAAARAAPRDTGDASSTGRAGRISSFVL